MESRLERKFKDINNRGMNLDVDFDKFWKSVRYFDSMSFHFMDNERIGEMQIEKFPFCLSQWLH